MRLLLSLLIISIVLGSCNSNGTRNEIKGEIDTSEKSTNDPIDSTQLKDTFEIYLDTLHQIENTSLSLDSFKYLHYYDTKNSYNIIYHETGKIKKDDKQFGISVYSVNDTTIHVKLLKKQGSKWTTSDSINLYGIQFSPAMFRSKYSDFNQNGTNDLLLIFYHSMSVAYSHGYLIVLSEETDKLILIENSLDIPNLDVVNYKIISITHNHPGHEPKEYVRTKEYEISNNQLKLINSNTIYK